MRLHLTNPYFYGHYRGVDDYVWDGGYITKERFNKIQRLLKKNVKQRKNKRDYIFTGILKCAHCGSNIVGHSYEREMADGSMKLYKFYRCNKAITYSQCEGTGSFSEEKVEEKLIQSIEHEIEDYICHYELELKKEVYKPEVNVKEIKEEMDRLNKQWRKGRIQEKEYDYEYERLEKKLAKVEEEKPKEKDLTPLYDFMNSGWKNIYDTLDFVERRALWRSVIDYMEVDLLTKEFEIKFI